MCNAGNTPTSSASTTRNLSSNPPASTAKNEAHNVEDTSMAEVSDVSATVSSTKQPSQHERMQKIIEKGSPEELEAEMRRSQRFLEKLKTPLVDMASVNRDARHWIQQIGWDALLLA